MCNIDNSPNDKEVSELQNKEAYLDAQRHLQDLQEGYVPYDRIFTKRNEAQHAFKKLRSGELLEIIGTTFYWKRCPGEPIILYAENTVLKKYKVKGVVELCRVRVPEVWVGTGRFRVDWPFLGEEKDDPTPILISLYLYSTDPGTLKEFVDNDKVTAYLASIYFEGENAALLNDLAEERYMGLV